MDKVEKSVEMIDIPYGYGIRISKKLKLSLTTISAVANGKNKNPITRAKVKKTLDELISEDLKAI
jgi:hypothetical protein